MEEKDAYAELSSIRQLMERSTKFISLSGLSGVLAGIYAVIGAYLGYRIVYGNSTSLDYRDNYVTDPDVLTLLVIIALSVLVLSITTGIFLTIRQAKKKNENFWNPVSRRLVVSMSIPLVTGGILGLIFVLRQQYGIIAPSCLIFYGLALIAASQYTFNDVKWLGFGEIILGLLAAATPGYGLIFWVLGFGFLHILYGSIMHFKYNQ
ncbi:MAG: hypothetical protein EOO20_25765 [Chryseobacterium sp.]|nr:MAG: hypothetical protein EOO20_25765 [Chryseobacterium sp.]